MQQLGENNTSNHYDQATYTIEEATNIIEEETNPHKKLAKLQQLTNMANERANTIYQSIIELDTEYKLRRQTRLNAYNTILNKYHTLHAQTTNLQKKIKQQENGNIIPKD